MSAVAALVEAQALSTWNRVRREAGRGGQLAGVALAVLCAAVLGLPAVLLARLGWSVGGELRAGDGSLVPAWQAVQAGLAVGLGVLGGWRFRPAFGAAALARFPVRRRDLLVAELPASVLEVFPLLTTTGIAASHLGLAAAWPAMAPLVVALALLALLQHLAVLALAAAAWRWLGRHPLLLGVLLALAALGLADLGWEAGRQALRTGLPRLAAGLPGSRGAEALREVAAGRPAAAATSLAVALLATVAMLAVAARLHVRAMRPEGAARGRPGHERPPSLGQLFQRQVLATTSGRLILVMPLLMTAPFALLIGVVQGAAARGELMPEPLVRIADRLAAVPWPWVCFALVAVDAELWLNQFGWDRGAAPTLLRLPVAPERLLAGKLAGIARFSGLQLLLGAAPLLLVRPPAPADGLAGLGVAAFVVVTAGGLGQLVSVRFPRRVEPQGGSSLPLRLAWLPLALLLPMIGWLAAARATAEALGGAAAAAAAPVVAALVAFAAWRQALPWLGRQLHEHRERLATS